MTPSCLRFLDFPALGRHPVFRSQVPAFQTGQVDFFSLRYALLPGPHPRPHCLRQ